MGFDNPQHIAHHPSARVFGVAITTTKTDQEFGDQESTGCFRIYDDQTFTRELSCIDSIQSAGETDPIYWSFSIL